MRKQTQNKGMTLVELIITIAIIAVLVGFLAPQYLKYVHNSKVSVDIRNAQTIAKACDVAFAAGATGYQLGDNPTVLPDGQAFPPAAVNGATDWSITIGSAGVSAITLDGMPIYPEPKVSGGYYDSLYR